MNASRILAEKGSEVFTVKAQSTLLDAARELTDRKVGAVLILVFVAVDVYGRVTGKWHSETSAAEIASYLRGRP